MQPSIAGLLVALGLLLLDRALDGRLVIALMASLVFGATAFAALPALGGASPLIYTLFAMVMGIVFLRQGDFVPRLVEVFKAHPLSWCIVLVVIYALAGAVIFPRLFAGQTSVYVVERGFSGTGGVVLVRLAPSNFNVSQAGYLALAAASYFTVLNLAIEKGGIGRVRKAIFWWAILIAATGYLDLLGKHLGLGDLLDVVRTANYSMLTGDSHAIAGMPRINGAFSEASAFAAASIPACAFAFGYWRVGRNAFVLLLGLMLLLLIALSTSTTAYASVVICAAWLAVTAVARLLLGRIETADIVLLGICACAVAILAALYLHDETLFAPFVRMLDMMLVNKASSVSAIERGAWNSQGLQAFWDTWGLGVGVGSTRTSSWLVAVVSQLGALGAAGMLAILLVLLRGVRRGPQTAENRRLIALATGCRAGALAGLVSDALTSATSDVGVMFYVSLATIVAVNRAIASTTVPNSTERRNEGASLAG